MYVKIKELPEIVREALKQVGYHRADIEVTPAKEAELVTPYGDGYQSFAVGIDTRLNVSSDTLKSSYGGSGRGTLDRGGKVPLPEHGMLIVGQRGGADRHTSAELYAHPALLAPLIGGGPKDDLTLEELYVLKTFSGLKPFARREAAERYKINFARVVEKLIKLGYVKMNKAGATQLTTAGKDREGGFDGEVRKQLRQAGYFL